MVERRFCTEARYVKNFSRQFSTEGFELLGLMILLHLVLSENITSQ